MKIRIKGNSIRIRLTKTEVEKFGEEGYLEEQTYFLNGVFTYVLRSVPDAEQRMEQTIIISEPTGTSGPPVNENNTHLLTANLEGQKIFMLVPDAIKKEWVETNKIGFSNYMPLPGGQQLFLLLEKDFKCIDGEVLEDQSDNYDNPSHVC